MGKSMISAQSCISLFTWITVLMLNIKQVMLYAGMLYPQINGTQHMQGSGSNLSNLVVFFRGGRGGEIKLKRSNLVI